jgi:HEAT repeat protein
MTLDPVVRKIVTLLASDALERQIAAVIVLGEIGARDATSIDGVIALAEKGALPAQRHAVEALGRLGARRALPAILGLIAARDEDLRGAAVAAVVAFQEDAIAPVKQRLQDATDPTERRSLEEILGRVGGKDAFAALLGALGTSDVEAAKAATLAARQKIKDASPRERGAYLAQVNKLLGAKSSRTDKGSPPNKVPIDKAPPHGKASPTGKPPQRSASSTTAALKILGYLEDPAAVPTLLSFAKNDGESETARQEAVIALRFTAHHAPPSMVARTAAVLMDLAEKEPLPLARAALYTLASLPIPPALTSRLASLSLRGEPERAQLAIERLGQMPGKEAGAALATVLAKTTDRFRAETAAGALGARPEAARVLGAAVLEASDGDRAQLLIKLLMPRVADLAAGAAEKQIAKSLVQAALARADDPHPDAHALLMLARKIDAEAVGLGLRALALKLRKAGKHAAPEGLLVLRRLGHAAEATPDDGYALASAELAAGRRDEAVSIMRQLLDRGYDVPVALRKDKTVDLDRRYQIGFQLMEDRHPAGAEILEGVERDGGRSKVARMAKAKLKSAGAV